MTGPECKPDPVGGSSLLTDSRSPIVISLPPSLRASISVSDNWSGNYAVINRDGSRASAEPLSSFSSSSSALPSCSQPPLLRPPAQIVPSARSSLASPRLGRSKIKDSPVREHVELSLSFFVILPRFSFLLSDPSDSTPYPFSPFAFSTSFSSCIIYCYVMLRTIMTKSESTSTFIKRLRYKRDCNF